MGDKLYINCDGGARGNPGPAACAFFVRRGAKTIYKYNHFIGRATNNVAEYKAVIAALTWVNQNSLKLSGLDIIFFLDSELVTRQLSGDYKTKNPLLKKLFSSAKYLEASLSNNIFYKLVPREKNIDADFLVNEILNKF